MEKTERRVNRDDQGNCMSLGMYIARRRKYLKLTQQQLADRIHVSKSAVAKWETDGGIPDRDNLIVLADALNVSVELLYRISSNGRKTARTNINITDEIIELLESYGYVVIPPAEGADEE